LGAVPVNQRFFQDVPVDDRSEARELIFTAARLYIFCYAIFGMFFLNTYGFRILERDTRTHVGSQIGQRAVATSDGDSERVPEPAAVQKPEAHPPRVGNLKRSKSNVSSMSGKTYEVIPETPRSDAELEPAGLEHRSVSVSVTPPATQQSATDPGPQRYRCETEPAPSIFIGWQKHSSIRPRMALYPFDERPPPVRGLRTDGPNLRGAVEGGPRRRSLGMAEVRPHGFLADSSDDEQLKLDFERGTGSRGTRAQTWDASTNGEAFLGR